MGLPDLDAKSAYKRTAACWLITVPGITNVHLGSFGRVYRVGGMAESSKPESLEEEALTVLEDLEQVLIELIAANAGDPKMLAKCRLLMTDTKAVRKRFAPHCDYLKDPDPGPPKKRAID